MNIKELNCIILLIVVLFMNSVVLAVQKDESFDITNKVYSILSLSKGEDSFWPEKMGKSHPCLDALLELSETEKDVGAILISILEWDRPLKSKMTASTQNITYALCKIYNENVEYGKTVYGVKLTKKQNYEVYLFWENYLLKKEYSAMLKIINENIAKKKFEYESGQAFVKFGNLFDPKRIHCTLLISKFPLRVKNYNVSPEVYVFEKRNNTWIQVLVKKNISHPYVLPSLSIEDYNGDGYKDFMLFYKLREPGMRVLYFWLYNPQSGDFNHIPEFQGISNPSFDSVSKNLHTWYWFHIITLFKDSYGYITEDYIWDKYKVIINKKVEQSCNNKDRTFHLKIYERKNGELVLIKEEKNRTEPVPDYWNKN